MAAGPQWVPAYIGIGSNLDGPEAQVRAAIDVLAQLPQTRLIAASALYASPPMDRSEQPDYVNAVASLLTQLEARALLDALHALEHARGRDRQTEARWGPRPLDLDLLIYGMHTSDDKSLKIPHPGIPERNFVLFPLLELAPRLHIPGMGPVWRLAAASDEKNLRRLP